LFNLQTSSKGTANELGTGLGLYLSNEAALQSGGRVFAESTINEGSTFWLELPIA
jgi:two-component system, sensor histidine kinase and response regulator